MGMFDTINGDQVKMFAICYPLLREDGSYEICQISGDLKDYITGDEVPWKRRYYNLGKNFDIIDMNADDYEFDAGIESILVHEVRNGRVFASIPFKKHNGTFRHDTYTSHGVKFKKISSEILIDYKEKTLYLQQLKTPSDQISRELHEYYRNNKDDKDFEVKCNELMSKLEKQREEDREKYYVPVWNQIGEYLGSDFLGDDFDDEQKLGILIDSLAKRSISFTQFVVYDERLQFIALATEALKLYEKVNLNHYFERFEIDSKEFEEDVKDVSTKLNILRQMKFKKEQFVMNALEDLEKGTFKKAYEKYNVIPFED